MGGGLRALSLASRLVDWAVVSDYIHRVSFILVGQRSR
jgi:hypothetical protein